MTQDATPILHMLDPRKHVSPFDVNMAADAGFKVIVPYTNVEVSGRHAPHPRRHLLPSRRTTACARASSWAAKTPSSPSTCSKPPRRPSSRRSSAPRSLTPPARSRPPPPWSPASNASPETQIWPRLGREPASLFSAPPALSASPPPSSPRWKAPRSSSSPIAASIASSRAPLCPRNASASISNPSTVRPPNSALKSSSNAEVIFAAAAAGVQVVSKEMMQERSEPARHRRRECGSPRRRRRHGPLHGRRTPRRHGHSRRWSARHRRHQVQNRSRPLQADAGVRQRACRSTSATPTPRPKNSPASFDRRLDPLSPQAGRGLG